MKATSDWMGGYLKAWESNDPEVIGQLFTEEALYYTAPYREPWRGRQAIVDGWLGRRDEPGTWSFEHEVLSEQGTLGVVRGVTDYPEQGRRYSNLWLIRLDQDGRCREFIEYFMLQD